MNRRAPRNASICVVGFERKQRGVSCLLKHEKAAAGLRISDGLLRITSRGDVSPRLIRPYRTAVKEALAAGRRNGASVPEFCPSLVLKDSQTRGRLSQPSGISAPSPSGSNWRPRLWKEVGAVFHSEAAAQTLLLVDDWGFHWPSLRQAPSDRVFRARRRIFWERIIPLWECGTIVQLRHNLGSCRWTAGTSRTRFKAIARDVIIISHS